MSSRARAPAATGPGPGSSRSRHRDHDSRPHRDYKDKHKRGRSRSRSRESKGRYDDQARNRSRSPVKAESPPKYDRQAEENKRRYEHLDKDAQEEALAPPPPPRITKISIGFSKAAAAPIKMNLGAPTGNKVAPVKTPKQSVASVFNTSDDEEPEEMPAEARMRMRNIGRETPTSAGPNSFGKTKHGFCDSKKVFERTLKEQMDSSDPKAPSTKFPQTIYKLNSSNT